MRGGGVTGRQPKADSVSLARGRGIGKSQAVTHNKDNA